MKDSGELPSGRGGEYRIFLYSTTFNFYSLSKFARGFRIDFLATER